MKLQMGFTKTSAISADLVLETEGVPFSFEEFSCSLGWPYVHYKAEDDPHSASPSRALKFQA